MNTTFLLDGGAGRVLSAIPALETYHQNNPDDDFKVLLGGWECLFEQHPILGSRIFAIDDPNSFDNHILNYRCVHPEPYRLYEYYHDRCSMAEAFDIEINGRKSIDIYKPSLYVHYKKDKEIQHYLNELKLRTGKDKIIVFQPFGSTSFPDPEERIVQDHSGRGISQIVFNQIVSKLAGDAIILFFGIPPLYDLTDRQTYTIFYLNPDLSDYAALVANCDYFVGCDSIGQHMARCFDKPGLVLMGGTFESNVSYPDYKEFKFYRKPNTTPVYNPMRFSPNHNQRADQFNRDLMNFNEREIQQIVDIVSEDING